MLSLQIIVWICVTPSSVTNTSLLDGTVFDNVNVVVEPFAVNSSTVLSVRSFA